MTRENRKAITFNTLILEIIEEEINRRGGQTTYSALVNELFAEKFAKDLRVKELELKANQLKFQR